MDLKRSVKITFGTEGNFTVEPEYLLAQEASEEERSIKEEIRAYMVRTAFSNSVLSSSPRKKAFEKVKRQTMGTIVTEEEARQAQMRCKADSSNNIFHHTSLNPLIVWQMYCTQTENALKGGKAGEEAAAKEESNCHPEAYQLLMVTSNLLMSIFDEKCMKSLLRSKMKEKQKDYENAFGKLNDVMKKVPILENETSALPGLGRIPVEKFRRVISSNLASIAAFFASAIYDKQSINRALALLAEPTGEAIPQMENLFPDRREISLLVPEDEVVVPRLFDDQNLDDGPDFVKNVVDVLNKLAEVLGTNDSCFKKSANNKIYSKRRLEALLFRTLASDLVEIFVSHGRNPFYRSQSAEHHHPWFMKLLSNNRNTRHPLSVVLEYVVLAIDMKQVSAVASHCYNSRGELVPVTLEHPTDNATGEGANEQVATPTPKPCNIRYYFKLVGAKKVKCGEQDNERHDFNEWLRLPEVVNAILYGLRNPWIVEGEAAVWIDWVPDFPPMNNKKISLWTSTKGKGKKRKIKVTVMPADAGVDSQGGGQAGMQHGATATTVSAARHPAAGVIEDQCGEANDANDNEIDVDQEGAPADRPEESDWLDINDTFSDLLHEMIDPGRYEDQDQEEYLEYLDSMKDMGIAIATLAKVQKELIMKCKLELTLDPKVDMVDCLKELQHFVLEKRKTTAKGKPQIRYRTSPLKSGESTPQMRVEPPLNKMASVVAKILKEQKAKNVMQLLQVRDTNFKRPPNAQLKNDQSDEDDSGDDGDPASAVSTGKRKKIVEKEAENTTPLKKLRSDQTQQPEKTETPARRSGRIERNLSNK